MGPVHRSLLLVAAALLALSLISVFALWPDEEKATVHGAHG